jgi:hypothetical protein
MILTYKNDNATFNKDDANLILLLVDFSEKHSLGYENSLLINHQLLFISFCYCQPFHSFFWLKPFYSISPRKKKRILMGKNVSQKARIAKWSLFILDQG